MTEVKTVTPREYAQKNEYESYLFNDASFYCVFSMANKFISGEVDIKDTHDKALSQVVTAKAKTRDSHSHIRDMYDYLLISSNTKHLYMNEHSYGVNDKGKSVPLDYDRLLPDLKKAYAVIINHNANFFLVMFNKTFSVYDPNMNVQYKDLSREKVISHLDTSYGFARKDSKKSDDGKYTECHIFSVHSLRIYASNE